MLPVVTVASAGHHVGFEELTVDCHCGWLNAHVDMRCTVLPVEDGM